MINGQWSMVDGKWSNGKIGEWENGRSGSQETVKQLTVISEELRFEQ